LKTEILEQMMSLPTDRHGWHTQQAIVERLVRRTRGEVFWWVFFKYRNCNIIIGILSLMKSAN